MKKIFHQVPTLINGLGAIYRFPELLPDVPNEAVVIIVDSSVRSVDVSELKRVCPGGFIKLIDVESEPSVRLVDSIYAEIASLVPNCKCLVGVGGGSVLDITKAVSILYTNSGSSGDYRGWDLVENEPVFKIGVPTLFGSGSEASRTAVLSSPGLKRGINSRYSMFDAVILDPELARSCDPKQRFYSGMDCYIHCVESLCGTLITDLAASFASSALKDAKNVFLNLASDDVMPIASFFGGTSIVNSEVGICHALSYGLSVERGIPHGLANCIVFPHLSKYYGHYVDEFNNMLEWNSIELPQGVCRNSSHESLQIMAEIALSMEKPLENALGPEWRKRLSQDQIIQMYRTM